LAEYGRLPADMSKMDLQDLRASLSAGRPPVEIAAFNKMYQRTRVSVNALIAISIIASAPRYDAAHVVVPGVFALALTVILHAWRRSSSPLAARLTIDTVAYMLMIALIDVPEVALLVALAQTAVVYLNVRPGVGRWLAVLYLGMGLATTIATTAVGWQERTTIETITIVTVVCVIAVLPTIWTLSQLGLLLLNQREREQALLNETKQLLADKDRFVASVSHELRTPLAAVVGLAHTLSDAGPSLSQDEKDEFTQLIVEQSEEVAAIVDDLLVAARAGSGHLALVVGEVNLFEEVKAIAPGEFPMDISGDDTLVAVGDPIRVRQVLRNLVSNAQRYGGKKKRVRISRSGIMGIVRVQDNGEPIPATESESIFAAYGRAHDRPGRTDSVGLGLTVSRQLARMMGGDVTYSHDGKWAAFELSLPLSVTETAEAICTSPTTALAAHGVADR